VHHVITHAGLHQSSELEQRKAASLEHLSRAADYAASMGVTLLLENLNVEPPEAEVHYMGHSIEELSVYFSKISASGLKWGFSANHMHLLPGDFDSFIDAFGVERIGLVLTADNRGQWEEHLVPGAGSTFGNREQKLAGREYLLAQASR
jgi:sugar phosphate isomerase/epimerase